MKAAFSLAYLIAGSSALESELEGKFMMWAIQFGKSYSTISEYANRLENWIEMHTKIESHNAKPDVTYKLGHNQFSDWTHEEYKALLTFNADRDINKDRMDTPLLDTSDLPDSINWIEKGAVGDVRDQANCGSCWAFSAVAAMEGRHFINSGDLLDLSEQQCVDCDPDSYGCAGG